MSDSTWTEVPAPDGRRCWMGAWSDEGCVVLEHEPEWHKPWVATATSGGGVRVGKTPREALDGIGCDLPAPDVGTVALTGDPCNMRGMDKPADLVAAFARNDPGRQPDPEPDERPVMAWGDGPDGEWFRDPQTGVVQMMPPGMAGPCDLAKAMGWRAVEVCDG